MRTTVRLDEHLLREVKNLAAEKGTTLTAMIEQALRELVLRRHETRKRRRVRLPTDGSGGVLPGVDLDDTASLLDIMDDVK